jgi:hypothetical protein
MQQLEDAAQAAGTDTQGVARNIQEGFKSGFATAAVDGGKAEKN